MVRIAPLVTWFLAATLVAARPLAAHAQSDVSMNDASQWIAVHLPSFYIQTTPHVTTTFHAKYVPKGCALSVDIQNHIGQNQVTEYDQTVQFFIVKGEPAPGKQFDGAYGRGTLDLRLLDLSSLKVQQEQKDTDSFPLAFGWGGFDFPFDNEDDANRVEHAIRYLAKRCGAKASPF